MIRPPLEVADIIAKHGEDYLRSLPNKIMPARRRVLRDLTVCRTALLGGHTWRCDKCGHERVAYNACRNRHCPKCQASAPAKWVAARSQDLLPVDYSHVVFTVPRPIADLALQNKKVMYGILMKASAETLKQIATDPRYLGAKIGFLAVLHTWSQELHHHPHVHIVVPAGGLSVNGDRWISCPRGFFLPIKVLARLFRGKLLAMTREAFAEGKLRLEGNLADPHRFAAHLGPLYDIDWNVYARPPFGSSKQVYKYLARYTHRVAISNHRLISLSNDRVQFRYKNRSKNNRPSTCDVSAVDFIRRFLLHVLPRGFVRIRHYGFLANRNRAANLDRCRELIQHEVELDAACVITPYQDNIPCPMCKTGRMVQIQKLPESSRHHVRPSRFLQLLDSS